GAPSTRRAPAQAPTRRLPEGQRPSIPARVANFLREVRSEISKVLWPKRQEVVNYSTVVLTTLIIVALLIFGLNYAFAKGVVFLFPH
ncbi:MAG: preprotein translocase subunit SecE, partial [Acidimicrobiales bacterium]